jgi:hypothetical protein
VTNYPPGLPGERRNATISPNRVKIERWMIP